MFLICFLIDMIIGPKVSQNSLILGDYFFLQLNFFAYKMCLILTKNTIHAWTKPMGNYHLCE